MNAGENLAADGSVALECRKKTSRVLAESLAVVVVCFVFAGLAWGLLASLPVLRTICVIILIASAVILVRTLAKNPPWLVLANGTLKVRCYPLGVNGELGKAKQLIAPLESLERVWVGSARDYPSDLLVNHADSRTFPWATTMVMWRKNERNPYLVREFSWFSETERLLDHLRSFGIRVETHRPSRTNVE